MSDPYADEYQPPVVAPVSEPEPAPEPEPEPKVEKIAPDFVPTLMSRYDKATGLIHGHFSGMPATAISNLTEEFGMWIGAHVDGFTHYIDVTASPLKVAERPVVAPPSSPQAAGWGYDLTALPAGTVVTVENGIDEPFEFSDLTAPLTFEDPGTYHLTVAPPAPHVGFDMELEIT